MVIKNHSAYLLQTAQTQIAMLLLNQFLRELFEIVEQCLSTCGKYGKARRWVDPCVGCALWWILDSLPAGCCCQTHVKKKKDFAEGKVLACGLSKRGEKYVFPPGPPPPPSWRGDAVCGWAE